MSQGGTRPWAHQGSVDDGDGDGSGSSLPAGWVGFGNFGPVSDATELNALMLRESLLGGATIFLPRGAHRFRAQLNVKPAITLLGPGEGACTMLADDSLGNIGTLFDMPNAYGARLTGFSIGAVSQRTAGKAINIRGGDATKPLDSFRLSAAKVSVDRVDMDNQFDGCVIENNGVVSNWLAYVDQGRWGNFKGDGLRIDCPGVNDQYGASHFVSRLFIYNNLVVEGGTGPVGSSYHIKNSGDFNIRECESFGAANGLLIDPPAAAVTGGRLSTGRFKECFFEVGLSGNAAATILPQGTAVFADLDFNGCWFAGAQTHGVLVNNSSAGSVPTDIRFRGSQFFRNTQYGLVLTGTPFAQNITVDQCQFEGNTLAGFRAVSAKHFAVRNSIFTQGHLPFGVGTQISAGQVDLGCDFFIWANNDTVNSTGTPFVDNSGGGATKVVANNL